MTNELELLIRAQAFCYAAHNAVGQKRKYTDEPYWIHPWRVASIIATSGFSLKVTAAAYLHDVVEDTSVTLDQIEDFFGEEVATYVENVTDVSKPEDGNRKVRKRLDLEHLQRATYEGKSIKLADLIDNSKSIVENDQGFAKVYLREKEALLREALYDGHPKLLEQAWEVLENSKEKLFG